MRIFRSHSRGQQRCLDLEVDGRGVDCGVCGMASPCVRVYP